MLQMCVWAPGAEYKCLTSARQSPLQTGSDSRNKQILTMRENLWTNLFFLFMLIISSSFSFVIGKESKAISTIYLNTMQCRFYKCVVRDSRHPPGCPFSSLFVIMQSDQFLHLIFPCLSLYLGVMEQSNFKHM